VTLDTEAPELTIESPSDGEMTNRETATVEGTVSDANLDTVTVNGQETAVDDGEFSQRIMLDEGENVIEVVATDLAGNATTETITIFAKYTAPEIFNLTPEEDHYLETGQSVKIEFESEPGLRTSFMVHMPLTNRSEEHTSELQSRFDLVCRLLLEKKNQTVMYREWTRIVPK